MPGPQELHELDPVRGLPEHLPDGEMILWQGGPDWWSLTRRAFHIDLVIGYFVLLVLWRVLQPAEADAPPLLVGAVLTLLVGALGVGVLMFLANLICRTTIYTITNRRVVMQFGVALPLNLNLPFEQIEAAGHRAYRDGTGDLPLKLAGDDRIAWFLLWPHARPWFVREPQPMLRCLKDSEAVAQLLGEALARYHGESPGDTLAEDAARESEVAVTPKVVRTR